MANNRELSQFASFVEVDISSIGITTSVGIGTTNTQGYELYVNGDVNVAGIVTATTFIGAVAGTATSTTNIPNLTGAITSNNTTTSLGSFTSANLSAALTDETGSGSAVFSTSPTLVTPVLGAASATSIVVSSGSTFTNGPVLIGSGTSTGTASQPLQVTGGAYVSGNLGIGTTNPQAKLDVSADALISGLTVGKGTGSVSSNTALGNLRSQQYCYWIWLSKPTPLDPTTLLLDTKHSKQTPLLLLMDSKHSTPTPLESTTLLVNALRDNTTGYLKHC
jgi:hypothetical protein